MLISIASFVFFALIFVKIFSYFKIPDVVAMIFAGIFIKTFNLYDQSIFLISSELRQIALVIIILRAGLSLDLNKLKKVGKFAFLLSFIPAIVEIFSISILLNVFLKIPLLYGLIAGCTISAVSPAIIIPRMINLQNLGYGSKKNIPELITVSSSLDDILVIILFYSFVNIATNSFSSFDNIVFNSLLLLITSFILSIIIAFAVYKIISKFTKKTNSVTLCIILLFYSLYLSEIEKNYNFSALLVILITGILYRYYNEEKTVKISSHLSHLWSFFSIILFVLVGISVDFSHITNNILITLLILVASVTFRCISVLLCLKGSELDTKERLFCCFAFIPKATVQASLGYIPLSLGILYGDLILSMSTLSIIIFATFGATVIDSTFKNLLTKE